MSPGPPLEEVVRSLVEPWMDVLLVGLSPELFAGGVLPAHLSTVRQGGDLPRTPRDAVFLRWNDGEGSMPERVGAAAGDLRPGGFLGVVLRADAADCREPACRALEAAGCSARVHAAEGGCLLVSGRKRASEQQDLVGLRRTLKSLSNQPDRLDALLAHVEDTVAGEQPAGGRSLKEILGLLGDLDRHVHLPLLQGDPSAVDADAWQPQEDFGQRPLAELLDRYRHFRYQSTATLERMGEADFKRALETALPRLPEDDAPPGPRTIFEALRAWLVREEELIAGLEARIG